MAGGQTRITSLVALRLRLSFGLVQSRLGRLQNGFAPLQLGAADEVLCGQGLKALEVCCGQIPLALRSAHLSLGCLRGQLVVLRVNQGQQLPSGHPLPHLNRPLHQFAAHPKAQPRLHPRPHVGGKFTPHSQIGGGHREQLDRA